MKELDWFVSSGLVMAILLCVEKVTARPKKIKFYILSHVATLVE